MLVAAVSIYGEQCPFYGGKKVHVCGGYVHLWYVHLMAAKHLVAYVHLWWQCPFLCVQRPLLRRASVHVMVSSVHLYDSVHLLW
jgi:hypothetical protein